MLFKTAINKVYMPRASLWLQTESQRAHIRLEKILATDEQETLSPRRLYVSFLLQLTHTIYNTYKHISVVFKIAIITHFFLRIREDKTACTINTDLFSIHSPFGISRIVRQPNNHSRTTPSRAEISFDFFDECQKAK